MMDSKLRCAFVLKGRAVYMSTTIGMTVGTTIAPRKSSLRGLGDDDGTDIAQYGLTAALGA